MKRFLAIVFLAIIVFGAWWLFFKTDKAADSLNTNEEVRVAKKHSEAFNNSIANAINSYLDMKSAFVEADTMNVKTNATKFISAIDSIKTDEFQKEDAQIFGSIQQQLSDIKANATPILQETDITQMRQDFRMISENLYPFLKTIG
ncbi:MAG TPA: DUF3347 domain-containing protein, partial [Hanamia sp.]|nr:DUF3347 domain-containing protein [Hanamia sp.]